MTKKTIYIYIKKGERKEVKLTKKQNLSLSKDSWEKYVFLSMVVNQSHKRDSGKQIKDEADNQ